MSTYTLDQLRTGHHVTATDTNLTVKGTIARVSNDHTLPGVDVTDANGATHWVPVERITARTRPLSHIAEDIRANWANVRFNARPYLAAMAELDKITDMYGDQDGEIIVRYFLSNAGTWRGDAARELKEELRYLLGEK